MSQAAANIPSVPQLSPATALTAILGSCTPPASCILTPPTGLDARTVQRKHSAGPHTRPHPLAALRLSPPLEMPPLLPLPLQLRPRQVLESTYRRMHNQGETAAASKAAIRETS